MCEMFDNYKPSDQFIGIRIGLVGKFSIGLKKLKELLVVAGVKISDNKKEPLVSIVREASVIVFGKDPSDDELKRIELNEHNGYFAQHITEEELYMLLKGETKLQLRKTVEKKLDLSYSHYRWAPPVIKGNEFASLISSPLIYDYEKFKNVLSNKEIYVPIINGVNMNVFRQLIGNLGGYANNEYYDDTQIVMLGDETLDKLQSGIKDDVILYIEKKYNESDATIFNIQFTSQSEFLSWLTARQQQYADSSTKQLLNLL